MTSCDSFDVLQPPPLFLLFHWSLWHLGSAEAQEQRRMLTLGCCPVLVVHLLCVFPEACHDCQGNVVQHCWRATHECLRVCRCVCSWQCGSKRDTFVAFDAMPFTFQSTATTKPARNLKRSNMVLFQNRETPNMVVFLYYAKQGEKGYPQQEPQLRPRLTFSLPCIPCSAQPALPPASTQAHLGE